MAKGIHLPNDYFYGDSPNIPTVQWTNVVVFNRHCFILFCVHTVIWLLRQQAIQVLIIIEDNMYELKAQYFQLGAYQEKL